MIIYAICQSPGNKDDTSFFIISSSYTINLKLKKGSCLSYFQIIIKTKTVINWLLANPFKKNKFRGKQMQIFYWMPAHARLN